MPSWAQSSSKKVVWLVYIYIYIISVQPLPPAQGGTLLPAKNRRLQKESEAKQITKNKTKKNNNNHSKQQVVETSSGYFLNLKNQTANSNRRRNDSKNEKCRDKKQIVKKLWKRFCGHLAKILKTCTANNLGKISLRRKQILCMQCSLHTFLATRVHRAATTPHREVHLTRWRSSS